MNPIAKQIISQFDLQPHPEGGFFKETYRSNGLIKSTCLESIFKGDRNYATSIYFLITSDAFSAFHKINQDETWHFYKGSSLTLHMISPKGIYSSVAIGNNFENGEVPQFTVLAQHYFAAEVTAKDQFAFLGCTVAPGFDFNDFHLPTHKELSERFPTHQEVISRLTRT